MQFKKVREGEEHSITVPNHDEIALGTLNDILTRVASWNGVLKEKLLKIL